MGSSRSEPRDAQRERSGLRGRGLRELALFGGAYLAYDASRWIFAGDADVAEDHATRLIAFERSLGLAVEGTIQRALDSGFASAFLANVYLAAQLAVLPAALVWLYHRAPAVYRRLRTTVIATWLVAVPVFALYPVAPPRLAHIGLVDTVSDQAAVALTGHSTIFYNPYAAVPSLHVGFAFAIGVAAYAAIRTPWARLAALLWGPLVTVAVIATGNHYLLDVLAGLAATAAGYGAALAVARLGPPGGRATILPQRR